MAAEPPEVDTAKKDLLSQLECPICSEIYQECEQLPCGHSFCKGCIGRIRELLCPTCRAGFTREQTSPNWLVRTVVSTLLKGNETGVAKCKLCQKNKLMEDLMPIGMVANIKNVWEVYQNVAYRERNIDPVVTHEHNYYNEYYCAKCIYDQQSAAKDSPDHRYCMLFTGNMAMQKDTCFIKNVDFSINDQELKNMFEPFGNVKFAETIKNSEGKSKGFGFVTFDLQDCAEKAAKDLNGTIVKGRRLEVRIALTKQECHREFQARLEESQLLRQSGVNLFVRNLDASIDEKHLRDAFSKLGEISTCKVVKSTTGQSKCYGFIHYPGDIHAAEVFTSMNNQIMAGKMISVSIATGKGQKNKFSNSSKQTNENR